MYERMREREQRSRAHGKLEHRRLWQPYTPAGNYTIKNTQAYYCTLIKMPSVCSGGVASLAGKKKSCRLNLNDSQLDEKISTGRGFVLVHLLTIYT